jgi:hypothetical protein
LGGCKCGIPYLFDHIFSCFCSRGPFWHPSHISSLENQFSWQGMKVAVDEFVKQCTIC